MSPTIPADVELDVAEDASDVVVGAKLSARYRDVTDVEKVVEADVDDEVEVDVVEVEDEVEDELNDDDDDDDDDDNAIAVVVTCPPPTLLALGVAVHLFPSIVVKNVDIVTPNEVWSPRDFYLDSREEEQKGRKDLAGQQHTDGLARHPVAWQGRRRHLQQSRRKSCTLNEAPARRPSAVKSHAMSVQDYTGSTRYCLGVSGCILFDGPNGARALAGDGLGSPSTVSKSWIKEVLGDGA
ncbi:hypothetical protein CIB48_g561 [Xylaria polymorpha]|nr:hypothetical protein CIB48_g561 [Xylaria polymorpha]